MPTRHCQHLRGKLMASPLVFVCLLVWRFLALVVIVCCRFLLPPLYSGPGFRAVHNVEAAIKEDRKSLKKCLLLPLRSKKRSRGADEHNHFDVILPPSRWAPTKKLRPLLFCWAVVTFPTVHTAHQVKASWKAVSSPFPTVTSSRVLGVAPWSYPTSREHGKIRCHLPSPSAAIQSLLTTCSALYQANTSKATESHPLCSDTTQVDLAGMDSSRSREG